MKHRVLLQGITWALTLLPANGLTIPKSSKDRLLLTNGRMQKTKIAPVTRLHAIPPEVWTSFIPPAMGFYKSEWTVSYGYGFATALSALSLLTRTSLTNNPTFPIHAAGLVFYGFRLNIFLFLRNRISSRMKAFQKRIEERAQSRGNRLSRAPFVLGCGLLYFGLYTPLLLTSMISGSTDVPPVLRMVMKVLVAMLWGGYIIGAVADTTKSYVKETEKNGKFLVTSGIFSILRHPNYTGKCRICLSRLKLPSLACCLPSQASPAYFLR
jgi:protein-S-isoprenylcysteine O-methyltransferase Ste14